MLGLVAHPWQLQAELTWSKFRAHGPVRAVKAHPLDQTCATELHYINALEPEADRTEENKIGIFKNIREDPVIHDSMGQAL